MEKSEFSDGIGQLLVHIGSTMTRQADQILQERLGIGMSQFRILSVVEQDPGISQRKLGGQLGQTEASISRQIKLLSEKQMVLSSSRLETKRGRSVTLTVKGVKLLLAAEEILQVYYISMTDVGKQQKQLIESLVQIHRLACEAGRPYACTHFIK